MHWSDKLGRVKLGVIEICSYEIIAQIQRNKKKIQAHCFSLSPFMVVNDYFQKKNSLGPTEK